MATQRFDDRGLVVTAPDAVTVRQVVRLDSPDPKPGRAWRAPPRPGPDDPLLGALAEAGFAQIDAFDLKAPGGGTRAGLGAPAIEVTVGRGQEAVVLVTTEDGACHWMLPSEAAQATRGGLARTRRFEFRFRRADDDPAARRSLFSRVANFRCWVLRFIVTEVAARIDGEGPFGLVAMLGTAPGAWRAGGVAPLPASGAAPRILLAVHGTFSSTRTFAPLAWDAAGESFIARAGRRYAAVLGFDHKTLGDGAERNAEDLMRALAALAPPEGLIVDAFAHSRGGLILRSAIETAADAAASRVRFDKVAFVGCPLDGTHLADARNWRALTDLYTTLAMAAARASAALAPGVSAGTAALGAAIGVLGRFVQALAESAVDENAVPGLRSMLPGGPLVTALARAAARGTGARYATISSDFEPRLAPLLQAPLATLKDLVLDRVADDLFRGANDLVVDTASMAALAPYVLAEKGDFALGPNGLAYHTAYFLQPKVVASLADWFGLPEARAPDQPAASIEAAEPAPAVRGPAGGDLFTAFPGGVGARPSFSAGHAVRINRMVRMPRDGSAALMPASDPGTSASAPTPYDAPGPARPEPTGGAPAPADDAPAADVTCHFAAEMPPSFQVGAAVDLRVTLAREAIVPEAGTIAAQAAAAVVPDATLDIRVLAVSGCTCTVADGAEGSYPVPAAGVPTVHTARISGTAPGRAKVAVDILQKKRVICSLLLEPLVYADPSAPLVASATAIVPAVAIGGSLVLRIYEDVRDGKVTLTFVADCDDPAINVEARTEAMPGSIEDMTAQIYRGIERYTPETLDFARFEQEMAVLGRTLWRQLIPEDIADAIKDNRTKLKAIQVVSGSCRLPWELVRIPGPDAAGLSFAELGLVRWLPNCPWPGTRLSLAAGTIIRPDYDGTDGLDALPNAIGETDAIRGTLPQLGLLAPATWTAFKALLADEAFDLLHFAGHGAAQAEVVMDQPSIVLGKDARGRHDLFQSDAVADAFSASGRRPIVFLNACQAGRASRSFFGVDGFARAFLKPDSRKGAAAFIAPLWSVGDLQAKLFARTFYDQLKRGAILVDAVRAARSAARKGQEATWLSYTIYGDPFARVATTA